MPRLGAGGTRDGAECVGSEVVVQRASCVFSSQDGGEQFCLHHLSSILSGAAEKARCSFCGRKSSAQGNPSAPKQEQDLQSLFLPAQDFLPMQECISAAVPIHTDPIRTQSSTTVAGIIHESRHNLAAGHKRIYGPRCTGCPQGPRRMWLFPLQTGQKDGVEKRGKKEVFVVLEMKSSPPAAACPLFTLHLLLVLPPDRTQMS